MVLKKGYKQTEVGIIPEDWDVIFLREIFEFKNGLNKEKKYFGQGTPIVNYMDVYKNRGLYAKDIKGKVSLSKQEIKNFEVQRGDVFFTRTSETVEEVGISSIILDDVVDTVFSGFILRARPKNNKLDEEFEKYCYSAHQVRNQITSKSSYTTRALTNGNQLSNVEIAVPSTKKEQQTIAAVLSNVDALLTTLEALITKKRLIKQGAMQELLTGKKRLLGFSGKWEVKKLGEIGEITGAGIDKKIRPNEMAVRLVNYLDVYNQDFIYSKDLNHWVTAQRSQIKRCFVQKGDIFFTPSSEMPYDIGNSAVAMEDIPDAGYSYHVVRLRLYDDKKWDLVFRTYIFKTKYFLNQTETVCEGSGTRYVITLKKFRELNIYYPVDKKEQRAIAEILFDMDADITALEQRREKTRLLKEGMMQELLTGKIRLV